VLTRRTFITGASASGALLARYGVGRADTWPSRPVRIIVPYPPGGSSDITARVIGERLSQAFAQPFIVDNRPGGGGNIGMEIAARSPPDGYTIVLATTAHAINMTLFKKLTYDTVNSFAPVALLTENPLLLVVNPALAVKTVGDLIALAKEKPGGLSYASSGNGQSTHLSAELFSSMAGIKMSHVPYRGSAPGIADVIAGHVQLMFDTTQSVLPHVESGRVRALGVTSKTRLTTSVGEIPTIAESGLPGYEAIAWNGFLMPKGTPPDIVAKVNAAVVELFSVSAVTERFAQLRATTRPTTPDEFGAYILNEIEKWGKVVKDSGAQVD